MNHIILYTTSKKIIGSTIYLNVQKNVYKYMYVCIRGVEIAKCETKKKLHSFETTILSR